ncbi:hypothetical protein [uncultured Treponema sp.]|uniref:hypothetical protein n=1 Tax=uncultured Treponema sp. TaxID=162155 RepID=UPI00261D22C5|nr:hypothetical protein [uncultured Treponema sp.]
MFDIEEFVSEIRKETALSCTETLLSDDMLEAIRKYEESLRLYNEGTPDYRLDCYYYELNSRINVLEVEGELSCEQAWYLREKYLGMKRGE